MITTFKKKKKNPTILYQLSQFRSRNNYFLNENCIGELNDRGLFALLFNFLFFWRIIEL
jgi:hypothetical protein